MQYDVTHARLPGLESRGGASRRLPRSLPLPTVLAFSLSLSLSLSLSHSKPFDRLRPSSLGRLSRATVRRLHRSGGSDAKFPANPTNLSQPNIGR